VEKGVDLEEAFTAPPAAGERLDIVTSKVNDFNYSGERINFTRSSIETFG
jgi:hypothetical protein